MKVLTVVGARPQFIKAAMVSRELRKDHEEVLVHTGQHFDYNMSEIFFEELEIPAPDYNLGVSGGSHGEMTGKMIISIEEVIKKEMPDCVLLYGDTNSTMSGALSAVKLGIPIVHVEAGARLGTLSNPEEVNRIVTDHVSSLLLYCTESAKPFLEKEGLIEKSYLVGDPMYDAFLYYSNKVKDDMPEELVNIDGEKVETPTSFNYMTCHRQENTTKIEDLENILGAVEAEGIPCIYPVHPRNRKMVETLKAKNSYKNVIFVNPVGYLMSVYLLNHCNKVVTDSGGLQREAFFAKKQCVTVFPYVCWPETMIDNRNQLSQPKKEEIIEKLSKKQTIDNSQPFGDGHAARHIVHKISELIGDK